VSDNLVVNVCRLIRDFPSISEAEHSLSSLEKRDYGQVCGDVKGLASALTSLLLSPRLAKKLRNKEKCEKYPRETFYVEDCGRKIMGVYEKLLSD